MIGCGKAEEKVLPPDTFDIEEKHLIQDFTQELGNVSIPVKTSLNSSLWTVTSEESWCLVSIKENSIQLLVKKNEEPDIRSTIVKVKSSVKNYEIRVSQLGYGKAILVNTNAATLNSAGGEFEIKVTANVEYKSELSADSDWISDLSRTRALVEKSLSFDVSENVGYEARTAIISFVCTSDKNVNAACTITQNGRSGSVGNVELEDDIYIKPTGGKASEAQPGQDIDRCYDRSFTDNAYHSRWNQSANFPVTLEFYFDGTETIDYIIYHTRSGNGNFGELDIFTATIDEPEYKLYGSFDFHMQNDASKVTFKDGISKATKIKFSVKSGAGNYVSCQEMEFFKKNTDKKLDTQLLTVFKDLTCTELKEGVNASLINTLPGFFAKVAFSLKNNTYDEHEKSFRIRNYKPYSDVEVWARKLMTKRYSNLNNCTGIYANQGDTVIVLLGNTHGNKIAIQSIEEVDPAGETYFLEEGVNRIVMRKTGLLYIMYNTDLTSVNAKPITIHIPTGSGIVNGFFDLKEHQTDEKYAELLSKATYKYFCIRGDKIMFKFHLSSLNQYVKNNILSAITLWDNMVGWQQELMGIENVRPSQVNNHMFAISPEEGYMWASDYRIGFVYTYLGNILLYDNVMAAKDNAWGPAHEIGHVHQSAINWPSCTESSNNLFSNYTLYKLGKYCSRGSALSQRAKLINVENECWAILSDNELRMRIHWQLWNYYHRCGYKTDFYQQLFKALREDPMTYTDPGSAQLHFAKKVCKITNENLTDFFEAWGFFKTVNTVINDYGDYTYIVTQAMIDDTKNELSKYPAPKHAFQYLEDRKVGDVGLDITPGDVGHYSQFEKNTKITKTPTYTRNGQQIAIKNGDEAVAFEIKNGSKIIFFSNSFEFEVPANVSLSGSSIFAVQADGKRIAIQKQ